MRTNEIDAMSKLETNGVTTNASSARFSLHLYYSFIGGLAFTILITVPLLKNNYITYVVMQILFYAYLGQSWNIMCGYTGQLSFGHAVFFGIGAYTSSIVYIKFGVTPWVGMFIGGSLALIVGVCIGFVSFKYSLKGVYFAFITLAFGELFRLLTLFWKSLTNGAEGILIPWKGHNPLMFTFSVQHKYLYYYTIFAMLIGCTFIAHRIKKIRLGYFLAAIRENEEAAESLGIDTMKLKLIAIGISAFLTSLGGTFYAQYYQHFEPEEVFGVYRSFEIFLPVILGGGGNVIGPPIGAFVLQLFEEGARSFMPPLMHGFHRMLYGILIVVVIMYLDKGLIALIENWKDRMVLKYMIRTKG